MSGKEKPPGQPESKQLSNAEIAGLLREIALLLALQDENPFKVRAYERAARSIETLPEPLSDFKSLADLEQIPGLGEALARKLHELLTTGRLEYLERQRKQVPRGLVEVALLPGLGPKRAQRLFTELGIDSLQALEAAAHSGKLRTLKGFGPKLEANILKALAENKAPQVRHRLDEVEGPAEALLRLMQGLPEVEHAALAGSFRRRRATIGDVDLLVASTEPAPVIETFCTHGRLQRVLARGDTKASILLQGGLQVDLRVVPPESFGAALQYFTGSKQHNVHLRGLAKEKGFKLNEYGVFRTSDGVKVAGKSEEEVYAVFDLPCFPPELREDAGEFEAAKENRLPTLVELEAIRGDLHLHTTATDGASTLEEYARAALQRGYEYLAVTDPVKSPWTPQGLEPERLLAQLKARERLQPKFEGLTLLSGCEVPILPDGSLGLEDDLLACLDCVVAVLPEDLAPAERSSELLTQRLVKALQHPHVKLLAHPRNRRLEASEALQYDFEAVLKVAAAEGKALEVNAQPDRLDLSDVDCRLAQKYGVKLAICTGARHFSQLHLLKYGVWTARRGWVEAAGVVNTLPLDELRKWLAR